INAGPRFATLNPTMTPITKVPIRMVHPLMLWLPRASFSSYIMHPRARDRGDLDLFGDLNSTARATPCRWPRRPARPNARIRHGTRRRLLSRSPFGVIARPSHGVRRARDEASRIPSNLRAVIAAPLLNYLIRP